jgi:hypothetical protein
MSTVVELPDTVVAERGAAGRDAPPARRAGASWRPERSSPVTRAPRRARRIAHWAPPQPNSSTSRSATSGRTRTSASGTAQAPQVSGFAAIHAPWPAWYRSLFRSQSARFARSCRSRPSSPRLPPDPVGVVVADVQLALMSSRVPRARECPAGAGGGAPGGTAHRGRRCLRAPGAGPRSRPAGRAGTCPSWPRSRARGWP